MGLTWGPCSSRARHQILLPSQIAAANLRSAWPYQEPRYSTRPSPGATICAGHCAHPVMCATRGAIVIPAVHPEATQIILTFPEDRNIF
jgi:hypothetical protein